MTASVPFGAWLPLAAAPTVIPAGKAVVQLRLGDGLWRYPTGQSAMVWYGAGEAPRVAETLAARPDAALLLVRFRPSETAESALDELLRRFEDRFGSMPRDNRDGTP